MLLVPQALFLLLTFLNHTIKNLAFAVGGTLPLLALVIWGWGDCTTFFSNPARTGVIILALPGAIAYAFSGSSGLGIGHREDPSSRWIFVPLIIIAVAFAWVPPHLDRLNRWTIDGDTMRYLGLIITAIGGFVRVATVFELGHRFSIFVALQPDHRQCRRKKNAPHFPAERFLCWEDDALINFNKQRITCANHPFRIAIAVYVNCDPAAVHEHEVRIRD